MFSDQVLHELIALRPETPVLSIYLDVDPQTGAAETARLRLRQLIREYAVRAPEEVHRAQHFLDHEFKGPGRSLVIFACESVGLFKTFTFALPIRSRARLLDVPYVKPLAHVLENFGHYGVALVDQQGARLFHFHLGELAEQEGFLGEDVRHSKHGSGSSSPGRRSSAGDPSRYSDEVVDRNLRQAAEFAGKFFAAHGVRRVLIGAGEAVARPFMERLPKRWQSLVMGTFAIEMTAPEEEVLERAMSIAQAAEQAKDERMLQTILDAAAKGGEGVIKLEETLAEVYAGKVQTLVIRDGYRAPGHRCTNCGFLSQRAQVGCPYCGGDFQYIEDAVEFAVQSVISNGGEVEVIPANPLLEKMGNIGALLRY